MEMLLSIVQGPWWCPMCGAGPPWRWGMMILMTVVWLAVLGLVFTLLWRLLASRGWPGPPAGHRSAEDILRERYASGEIDRDTYQRMMADLRHSADHEV